MNDLETWPLTRIYDALEILIENNKE